MQPIVKCLLNDYAGAACPHPECCISLLCISCCIMLLHVLYSAASELGHRTTQGRHACLSPFTLCGTSLLRRVKLSRCLQAGSALVASSPLPGCQPEVNGYIALGKTPICTAFLFHLGIWSISCRCVPLNLGMPFLCLVCFIMHSMRFAIYTISI